MIQLILMYVIGVGWGWGYRKQIDKLILHVMYVIGGGGGGIEKCELLIIRENSRVLLLQIKAHLHVREKMKKYTGC